MGLGDEIMALGRAEKLYEQTGKPVAIVGAGGERRTHDAWVGNPAWNPDSDQRIIDGPQARPYIKEWQGNRIIFNYEYKPHAGRIHLTEDELARCRLQPPYAIVSPHLKDGASPNKNWGAGRWAEVIKDFPIPVYQLCDHGDVDVIPGAIPYFTPSFRDACAAIHKAALVMCNEGGSHHMAASMGTRAVVIFGAFVPPEVTGYDSHRNIAVKTDQGYCGRWEPCEHCRAAMASITPEQVRQEALMEIALGEYLK